MPVVSLTRPNRFTLKGRLSFVPSTVIFEALVNQSSFNAQTLALTFDTVTVGAYTAIKAGMKVLVFSGASSTVKATMRVAAGGATSTVVQVNEVSFPGEVYFANNDMIQVIAAFNPRELLVSNTDQFLQDSRVSAGSFPSDPPPVCNSGGPVVGDIDAGTSLLAATHYGSTSWRTDSDAGSLTHAWTFPSGATPTSSTSTTPSVSYPEGFWWTVHTLTDSNGTTTTQYVPVFAYGPSYRPLPVVMTNRDASLAQGFATVEFSVPRAYAAQVLGMADNSLIVYDEAETRDGVTASYGSNVAGRSTIKFVGYLDSRSISISPDGDTLTFTAIGPAGVLAKLGALSQVMKTGTTSKWGYLKTLTVWKALWYLLWRGSSILLIHDFLMTDGTDYLYSQLTIDNINSVKGQLDDLAASICTAFTSDALGRLLLTRSLPYLSVAERAARTKTIDFTTALMVTLDWSEPMRPATRLVTIDGITPSASASSQTAVFGWAPGDAPGEGTDTASLDKQIGTKAQLYQRAGDEYRRLRGEYFDETTRAVRRVPMGLRITVIGASDVVDPLLLEPVSISLPATTNTLGISFASTELWIVTDVSASYDADAGTKALTLTLDHETHGVTGKSRPNPNPTADSGLIQTTDPNLNNPGYGDLPILTTPGAGTYSGSQRIAAICASGLALTPYFGSGDATPWSYAPWSYLGVSGTVESWCPNGYDPGSGWIATTTDLYYLNLATGAISASLFTWATPAPRVIDASFGARHPSATGIETTVAVTSYYNSSGGTKITHSLDGVSFTETQITAQYQNNVGYNGIIGNIYVSSKTAGLIYAGTYTTTGDDDTNPLTHAVAQGYKSTDYGATWALNTSPTLQLGVLVAGQLQVPWQGNPSENLAYYTGTVNYSNGHLMKAVGATLTDITPTISGERYTPYAGRNRIEAYVGNRNRMLMTAVGDTTLPSPLALFRSDDGGTNWLVLEAPTLITGVAIAGDNPDVFYLWGDAGLVAFSTDAGITRIDQSGNLPTFTPGAVIALGGF